MVGLPNPLFELDPDDPGVELGPDGLHLELDRPSPRSAAVPAGFAQVLRPGPGPKLDGLSPLLCLAALDSFSAWTDHHSETKLCFYSCSSLFLIGCGVESHCSLRGHLDAMTWSFAGHSDSHDPIPSASPSVCQFLAAHDVVMDALEVPPLGSCCGGQNTVDIHGSAKAQHACTRGGCNSSDQHRNGANSCHQSLWVQDGIL